MPCPACGSPMAPDPAGAYWCQNVFCERIVLPEEFRTVEKANIGDWERAVVMRYGLHSSWLEESSSGQKCYCCKKLRFCGHYITDTVVCVFCSVACRGNQKCKSINMRF